MLKVPDAANLALEEPVTLEEIYQAINKRKPHKALDMTAYDWNS
jgi:hypothetical protein